MIRFTTSRKIKGMAAVLGASLLFGLGYPLVSIVWHEGMSEASNGIWTGLLGIACNLVYAAIKRKNPFKRITGKQNLLCICCGFSGVWMCNYMTMIAYGYLSVPEVTMLHFLHPALIAIFMTVVFKERFSTSKLGAIILAVMGMTLVTGTIPAGSSIGILTAILSGIFYAVYIVLMEKTTLAQVDGMTVVLYMSVTSTLSALVTSLCNRTFMLPPTPLTWFCDAVLALSSVVAYALTAYAVRTNGATSTAFASMLEPIASCVFASLLLNETMGKGVLLGGVLIVLSVVFSSLNASIPKRQSRFVTEHDKAEP